MKGFSYLISYCTLRVSFSVVFLSYIICTFVMCFSVNLKYLVLLIFIRKEIINYKHIIHSDWETERKRKDEIGIIYLMQSSNYYNKRHLFKVYICLYILFKKKEGIRRTEQKIYPSNMIAIYNHNHRMHMMMMMKKKTTTTTTQKKDERWDETWE